MNILDSRNANKLLKLLFERNFKLTNIGNLDNNNSEVKKMLITRKEIKDILGFSDLKIDKYLNLMLCRNTTDFKFIDVNKGRYWLMDKGIEFYHSGGFTVEKLRDIIKNIPANMRHILEGIVAILAIYAFINSWNGKSEISKLNKRITAIEQVINNKTKTNTPIERIINNKKE